MTCHVAVRQDAFGGLRRSRAALAPALFWRRLWARGACLGSGENRGFVAQNSIGIFVWILACPILTILSDAAEKCGF